MIYKVDVSKKYGNSHISILYPGAALGLSDSGIGSLGRIDQANIEGGTTIRMHPHINDEILSYFRLGSVIHTDSARINAVIDRKKLMLMKAGKVFYHEEKIVDRLEGLQIFIRPKIADYEPEVVFYDLPEEDSTNTWRLIASNKKNSRLQFTSDTEVYDMTLKDQGEYTFPNIDIADAVMILYTFQGFLRVNNDIELSKGECLVTDEKATFFATTKGAEIVLFITNKNQDCFKDGMFSGNKTK